MADEKDITPGMGADDAQNAPSAEAFAEVAGSGDMPEGDAEAKMMAMLDELPADDSRPHPQDINIEGTHRVAQAQFQQLGESAGTGESRNIELLMDVSLPITIELGRTKMPISEILTLGPGSVVELNKLAGEPVDLMVNQKIVAKGEVVVIDENFGVRITQLITPEERLKLLGEE